MNTIWYRFYSEKDSHEIHFDTTEMSIEDIKKQIKIRRNMFKSPEIFDLIFYDEENFMEIGDKDLVKPMKHLIIKRFPHYKRENTFVKIVRDPHDISINKANENSFRIGEPQKILRYTEPLEKIMKKLNKDIVKKQFECKLCNEKLLNAVIFLCCKETFCINCYNKDDNICPNCKQTKSGFVKNEAEINLVKKLLDILEKKEKFEKIQREKVLQQGKNLININANIGNNQRNLINCNNNQNNDNINIKYNFTGNNTEQLIANQNIDPSDFYQISNQNPSISLIEGSQFFIIKSSNKENIEKSKKNSVWATTIMNSNKLNEAFKKGNVILIFSVNGTQSYKGYAIMTSCSADTSSNLWQIESNIKLGGDFSVVWLCNCELNSSKAKHLLNSKKNNDPVNKSRDCTELSQNCGYELCKLCFEKEKKDLENNPQQTKVQINKQLIDKINEEIKNNRNKQLKKNNKTLNNVNEKNENNNKTNEILINPILNNPIQQQIAPTPTPMIPMNIIWYNMMMQMRSHEPNNPVTSLPANNSQQTKQDTGKNDKNKKEKDRHKEKESKRKKSYKKHYYRDRNRDRDRRNRSRDKESGSRSRNKSRSSRCSNSDSSRSEGKSKYSKSYK